MNRKLKFRAWDKISRMWLKSFNVNLLNIGDLSNVEIMQYTWLKDKNGKEIYEGDLVKILDNVNETICEVRFEYGGYILKNGDLREELLYLEERFMEVVGNIYENEELLKREEKNDWDITWRCTWKNKIAKR